MKMQMYAAKRNVGLVVEVAVVPIRRSILANPVISVVLEVLRKCVDQKKMHLAGFRLSKNNIR